MAILEGDIKLLKSAVLDDVPEGGGMATGLAVIDGVSNNLFPDISELDRTYGRIALRKVFPAVLTDTVDGYYGAHVIVAQAPADPRVSAALFTTRSWSDVRTSAQNKLESYLALGAETRFILYGNHLVGQRSVQVHCHRSVATPGVGDVFGLVQRDAPSNYQYVRVIRIIARSIDQVFTDPYGDYLRDVLVLEISDPLRLAFAWRQRHPLHGRLLQPGNPGTCHLRRRRHQLLRCGADRAGCVPGRPDVQGEHGLHATGALGTLGSADHRRPLHRRSRTDCADRRRADLELYQHRDHQPRPGGGALLRAWRRARVGGHRHRRRDAGGRQQRRAGADLGLYRFGRLRERRGERRAQHRQQRQRHLHGGAGGGDRRRRAQREYADQPRQPRLQLRDQPLAGAGAGIRLGRLHGARQVVSPGG
jgi:hypothetical protein